MNPDYKRAKKTRATNSARIERLSKKGKLQSDNVTVWTGANNDLSNETLWVGGFIDGNNMVQVDGYFRTQSDAISELETILADLEKVDLQKIGQLPNAYSGHLSAIQKAAQLARDRGEHELAERILKIKFEP